MPHQLSIVSGLIIFVGSGLITQLNFKFNHPKNHVNLHLLGKYCQIIDMNEKSIAGQKTNDLLVNS
jgi:hypothetical protein